jgi:hypothetical protein
MKTNLANFFITGMWLFAVLSVRAQNYAEANQRGFSDSDLNAALGISDAWIWLQNSTVPLAMLVVFLGCFIIVVELHYRQNKMLHETVRRMLEKPVPPSLESGPKLH